MTNFFGRQVTIQLTLLCSLLLCLSSANKAKAEGLSGWLKDKANKITKEVGEVVDVSVKKTIDGNQHPEPARGSDQQQSSSQNTKDGATTASKANSGGGLKPTSVKKGSPVKAVAGLSKVEEKAIVSGDDLFKPVSMLTVNGIPLLTGFDMEASKATQQRAFLRFIGLNYIKRRYAGGALEDINVLSQMKSERLKEYGVCRSRRAFLHCDFKGSVMADPLNPNEFEFRRVSQEFNKKVLPRFNQRGQSLDKTFYFAVRGQFGKYDFAAGKLTLYAGQFLNEYWQHKHPKEFILSKEAAERVKSYGNNMIGLAKFTLDANGIARAKEVNYYSSEAYEQVILTVPLSYIGK